MKEWNGFVEGKWNNEINVSDFILSNYKEYTGDDSFLVEPTLKTKKVWAKCEDALKEELKKGVLDIDTTVAAGINNFKPGFIDKDNEVIVGLQTDSILKRIVNPFGGMNMVTNSLKEYGYDLNESISEQFKYRKTHNQGVFDVYTNEMRLMRKVGILTGLPDAYGRGRIIGDYRRLALYGVDYLIEQKKIDKENLSKNLNGENILLCEEVTEQINALNAIKEMALGYGFDLSKPAANAKEAIQFTYFGYLAAVKENNGAAMSLGRVDSFFDIYIERDLEAGVITEEEACELLDQFVIKLRLVRHLRTKEYDALFSGDPTWVTASIGGMTKNKSLVTKTSYRILNSLTNLGPAPEPNMTVLWSKGLPENFKKYCAKLSIETDSIQYENDDIMSPLYEDDYAIACCVSAMKLGKQMQYFGARCNLAKSLLYSMNGGIDEVLNIKAVEGFEAMTDEVLDYDKVKTSYYKMLEVVAKIYVDTMNIIHFMHDKYAYEAGQMALHDTHVERLMAFGVAGLSVVADSLSAIKYAKVKPVYENGLMVDFNVEGEFPKFGNDDDRVDSIASELLQKFYDEITKHELHRGAKHTLSVLTITSNVVYGEKTGSTPDGRKKGMPFAPGANPMHGRDEDGALASLNSVAKLKYESCCQDGISNTFSIIPNALGKDKEDQIDNLVGILDGYFIQNAHHLNVNVLNREVLIEAMNDPLKYPLLTIRVSGYAVRFNRLTKKQQEEVISRTFHETI